MSDFLQLNKNYVQNGLGTLTYTVTSTEAYNVQVQTTFPDADAINANWNDNLPGIGANHQDGLPYIGAGSGLGLGSGPGGGDQGFVLGDRGLGSGGKGLGFGTANNYPQPIAAASNETANSPTVSSLSIVVNKNGSPIYTSTAPKPSQGALQFKTSFLANSGDSITIVFSSSASVDNQLSGITSNVSIGQGL